jgi:hypothetical protein
MIDLNERMSIWIVEVESESHPEARAAQMASADFFSTMMADKASRILE